MSAEVTVQLAPVSEKVIQSKSKMRFPANFPAIVLLVPTVTCLLGGMAEGVLRGLKMIPAQNNNNNNEQCKQPFGNDAGNPLQTIGVIVTGLFSTCPYSRSGNQSILAQMNNYVTYYVLSRSVLRDSGEV